MTEMERKLCTNFKEIRQADICLLAIESYYRRTDRENIARKVHKFRYDYLQHFMSIIKEEKANE